jgi:hypothetical protein
MPTIEGLTTNEVQSYTDLQKDIADFLTSYQAYIQACNSDNNNCKNVSTSDIDQKMVKLGINEDGTLVASGSLAKFKNIVNDPSHIHANDDVTAMNAQLQKYRAEAREDNKILTDLNNSVEGDFVTKQNSHYYYNTIIYIGLASVLYFSFYQISSSK